MITGPNKNSSQNTFNLIETFSWIRHSSAKLFQKGIVVSVTHDPEPVGKC